MSLPPSRGLMCELFAHKPHNILKVEPSRTGRECTDRLLSLRADLCWYRGNFESTYIVPNGPTILGEVDLAPSDFFFSSYH